MDLVITGSRLRQLKIFGRTFGRKSLSHLSHTVGSGGWWPLVIREPNGGAWQRNESITVTTALQNTTLFRCIDLISGDIAKCWPKLTEKNGQIFTLVDRPSPFWNVLRTPNHYQEWIEFCEWWIVTKLLHGNFFGLKRRDDRGMVDAIYPIDPQKVMILTSPDGSIFYEVRPDKLSGRGEAPVIVPAREIIHDKHKPLFHPLVGTPPWWSCVDALLLAAHLQRTSAHFQANGAQPGGVITAEGAISPPQAADIKAAWEAGFTGTNAGKVAVLADGLQYTPMTTMSAKDADLVQQLEGVAISVCQAYGVPGYKVNVGEPPKYDNIQALTQQYYGEGLQLHIEKIEALLKRGLELPAHYEIELDLDALLRMDTATLIESEAAAVKAGIKAPNESRVRLNLPPVKGGETPYLQQQNFSLSALDERDRHAPAPSSGPSAAEPQKHGVIIEFKQPEKKVEPVVHGPIADLYEMRMTSRFERRRLG